MCISKKLIWIVSLKSIFISDRGSDEKDEKQASCDEDIQFLFLLVETVTIFSNNLIVVVASVHIPNN